MTAKEALNHWLPWLRRRAMDALADDLRDAADEIDRLQAENEALRKLAEHLRSCRDCGEWDVKDCSEGRPLWDAAMK
jgi:hypothetical protein